ncbi:MAG: hypothetical protein HRU15_08265, partial [Planctomycetes bacterium]|nr:hypothetical protein [Planctomycetota bacterium]
NDQDSALVWAHDAPLLSYIGVTSLEEKFAPAFYCGEMMQQAIADIREQGIQEKRNRNGIILGNTDCTATKTITHTMWSLHNLIPGKTVQKAHRHQSVAIDLALSAGPDTYTLIGKDMDEAGNIIDPVKAPWADNSIFITPPGWWHSHHNESDQDAYVFPFQDAGLHTYLRTLDIKFS